MRCATRRSPSSPVPSSAWSARPSAITRRAKRSPHACTRSYRMTNTSSALRTWCAMTAIERISSAKSTNCGACLTLRRAERRFGAPLGRLDLLIREQAAHGHETVSFRAQRGDDHRDRFNRAVLAVVHQNDSAGLRVFEHALHDLVNRYV